MCGIAGILSKDQRLDPEICFPFLHSIAHRGPDGQGSYFEPHLFLGHRRLKILDLSESGKQPMFFGSYAIVFNGEIYNFLELRKELEEKGYTFQSQTDTEIILAAYAEWGQECQLRFNGMWAFAIWDKEKKQLFLSRDRFGVKPLYIYEKDGYFAFASEIKAFTKLSFVDFGFNHQKVADTIEDPLCLEPGEETLFQGIRKLRAGHCMEIDSSLNKRSWQWWNTLDYTETPLLNEQERVQKFKSLFFDACSLRMRSDVSVGTALSGGLDSSSILCSIFQLNRQSSIRWPESWQKSFTAVFPKSSHDELEYAQLASQQVKADASFFPLQPADTLSHLETVLYSIEDIFDPPIGPWLLYREYRKQGVMISIDGHGADELLCGYQHQFEKAFLETVYPFQMSRVKMLWPLMKQMNSMRTDRSSFMMIQRLLKSGFQTIAGRKDSSLYSLLKRIYWQGFSSKKGYGRYGWLSLNPSSHQPSLEKVLNCQAFQRLSILNQALYLDFHQKTLPAILRNFDRCSMAHGIEIRAPFMDWRIVSYAFSLPSEAKVGSLGSKQILRSAMAGILPEPIRLRKSKIGFATPLNQWIENGLKEYILDVVQSQRFLQSPIWNGSQIALEAEQYMQKKNYLGLRKIWEFILADRLMCVYGK